MEELHHFSWHAVLSSKPCHKPDPSANTPKSVLVIALLPREIFNTSVDDLVVVDSQVLFLMGASQVRLNVRDHILAKLLWT
jgi:hypothetical protein